ncbi:IS5 family transposase [Rhizobium sp. 18055]|uniref:IS5 family transposase n=1 Tax=Rhizobium sp. 18055 TaxID=2681403 RepID=UPI001357F115|nr:IS5 family transposase [Rhizobium sp. 18055]
MPHKHNSGRRHRIGKVKFKVTNWSEYEAGLRRRGSLTLWMTPEALSLWKAQKRTTRGGQARYSDLAIETSLMLGLVFGLRLRQTEGFLASVLELMGLDLPVPDHTTLSRRAQRGRPFDRQQGRSVSAEGPIHVLIDSTGLEVYGAGQWLEEKHGARSRRGWRKLHLATNADSGEIIAHILTDKDAGDASQVEPLLEQIAAPIERFTADGAYDGKSTYDVVTKHSAGATIVIPPRSNAVDRSDTEAANQQRDRHITSINTDGRMKWQAATGYGKRSLVETAIGRYKSIIGHRLRARSFAAQQTELAMGIAILNRMLACSRPKSVRLIETTA